MRILQLHNQYTKHGGEDATLENEKNLLRSKGHQVEQLLFDNQSIKGVEKIKILYKSIYNSQSAHILSRKIKEFKPDIIHVHNLFYVASPAIFYEASKQKIPVVCTIHNFRLICSGALLLREGKVCELCTQKTFPLAGIRHKCFQNSAIKTAQLTLNVGIHKVLGTWRKHVTTYITLTHFIKKKLLNSSLELNSNQIALKPNFVEDKGFATQESRKNFFLFVGRLSPEKGIDILLKAASLYSFRLEIIGAGEMQSFVEENAKKNKDITYHGFQDKDFIFEKMKEAKALIFPSVWYEGMPLTLLEAFSTGTPIIISDIENLNEMVADQVNGLHFRTSDAEDLVEKIKIFEQNPLAHLYQNARKTYLEHFSPEKNYEILMNIYLEAIEKNIQKHS